MNEIVKKHSDRKIILLTENKYIKIANRSGWFDEVLTIERSMFYFKDKQIITKKIDLRSVEIIYDLQTSKRTSSYFSLFKGITKKWCGTVKEADFFHDNSNRDLMHTYERQKQQLYFANIKKYGKINLSWLYNQKINENIEKPYV